MSAFLHRRYVEEFRQYGGTLTSAQLAVVAGWGDWRRDIRDMRRLGYLIVEDPTDLFHLDLEELPELDAGRAADAGPSTSVCERVGSSPDADPDPQAESETPPLPLDVEPRRPSSPYDVEAA